MFLAPCSDTSALPGMPALQQHPHYAATLTYLGGQVQSLVAPDVAWLQVVRRRLGPLNIGWVPRGPVWAPDVTDARKAELFDQLGGALPGCKLRLLTPDVAADSALLRKARHRMLAPAQQFATLDLTLDQPARLARQHGKWRNRLRHAQKAGLQVQCRPFHPQADQHLLGLEMRQRRALGYKALPPGFTLAWATANRRAAQLFLARDAGGQLAYVLILLHAPTASYHIGWTSARGRAASCHNLLLWQASNWLADRGYAALDLGLVDEQTSPGLARFKTGIGADMHSTGPTMIALPRLRLPQFWHRAA